MKLNLALLERMIDLPAKDPQEIRKLLDDVGLEVKDILNEGQKVVFNIETLANRGDHLSAFGIARELSGRILTPAKMPSLAGQLSDRKASVPVICETDGCPKYALLEMQVPADMALRSDVAGIVSDPDPARHPIVHILNYVQLELGQPMHAFDREKIDGEVRISQLAQDETIEALDGKSYKVPSGSVVIRDRVKIIAVAGVIGCKNSMVTLDTRRVAIESANFNPIMVRKTARAMGISTDASYAFERGADSEGVLAALKRVVYLTAGADSREACQATGLTFVERKPTEKRSVELSLTTVRQQLGLARLTDAELVARLKNLGYQIDVMPLEKPNDKERKFSVKIPSWRLWDVSNAEDLLEDFARSHSFDRVRQELPPLDQEPAAENPYEKFLRTIEPVLIGSGFFEVISKSLCGAEDVGLVSELSPELGAQHLAIKNALEKANSYLKASNILHLARIAEANHRRGVQAVKIYEVGRLFSSVSNKDRPYEFERDVLTLGLSGRFKVKEWRSAESVEDLVLGLKGVVEAIAISLGATIKFKPSNFPLLHPGYQAAIKIGRRDCGVIGLIHPRMRDAVEMRSPFIYVELDIDNLIKESKERNAGKVVDFPRVRRDITLRVKKKEFASRVCDLIEGCKIENLNSVSIIDDFSRPEETFRRVTYRLTFQNVDRTLESKEVDSAMTSILEKLKGHDFELAV